MTITIDTVKENLEHYTHGLPPQEWEFLYNELKTVKNPDVDVLQIFLRSPYKKVLKDPEREQYEQDYMEALGLKLDGMTKTCKRARENDVAFPVVFRRKSLVDYRNETEGHYRNIGHN